VVSGRSLHIVPSGARINEFVTTDCRLCDFDATSEPANELLARWARRDPENVSHPADDLVSHEWNSGLKPGHLDMKILSAATGRPASGEHLYVRTYTVRQQFGD